MRLEDAKPRDPKAPKDKRYSNPLCVFQRMAVKLIRNICERLPENKSAEKLQLIIMAAEIEKMDFL